MANSGVQRRKLAKGYKYRYHLYHKGKKIFSPSIYDTEADALKARHDKLIELASSTDTSLFNLIDDRLKDMRLDKTPKYVDDTEYYLEIAKEAWGNVPVQTISKGMVKTLLNKEARKAAKKGVQNYAVNYLLRVLKALFQYCIDYHDIEMRNPCKGIKPLHIEKRDKYIPTDAEIEIIKTQLNDEQKVLVDVVRATGARINEILNLRAEDLDFERDLMTLYTRKSRNGNRTFRKIEIPLCLLEIDIPRSGLVFPQWRTHPKFIEKTIRDLNKDYGHEKFRKWSWHNLRHKWTTEAAANGMPMLMIMYNLGHTNYSTTQGYLNMLGISMEVQADSWGNFSADSSADSADISDF